MHADSGTQENVQFEEENDAVVQQEQEAEQPYKVDEEDSAQNKEQTKQKTRLLEKGSRINFVNGLSVGIGIGCLSTFAILWIAVFFTPLVPPAATYENLLSIFIFPLVYLLAIGLVALTAGVVREYFVRSKM